MNEKRKKQVFWTAGGCIVAAFVLGIALLSAANADVARRVDAIPDNEMCVTLDNARISLANVLSLEYTLISSVQEDFHTAEWHLRPWREVILK
jgi:hypothetical protein